MNRTFISSITFAGMLTLSACEGQYRNHGYMPLREQIDELVVGVDTHEDVIASIGAPTTSGVNLEKAIYYVRSRVHHRGYAKPDEVDREVLVLTFGENQILSNVERFGIEKGRVIAFEHRVTAPPGGDRSMMQQILASIGGFNAASVIDDQ